MNRTQHDRAIAAADWMLGRGFRVAAHRLRIRAADAWAATNRAWHEWHETECLWAAPYSLGRSFILPDWRRALSDARWMVERGYRHTAEAHWQRGARHVCALLDAQWVAAAMRVGLAEYGEGVAFEARASGVGMVEGVVSTALADFSQARAVGLDIMAPWQAYRERVLAEAEDMDTPRRVARVEADMDRIARGVASAIRAASAHSPGGRPVFHDRESAGSGYRIAMISGAPLLG